MTALVRLVHGSVVGITILVTVFVVGNPVVVLALIIVAPIAVLPWVFMPMLERALTWLQRRKS